MTWKIVSDSSCDLRAASFHSDSVAFELVPLRIQVGAQAFLDSDQLSVPELLAAMAAEKSAASSACPSPSAFAKAFAAGDRTVCITISSQLSGTYHAACIGREMALEEHPEKKIFVLDSRAASATCALLVRRAQALMEADPEADFEEVWRISTTSSRAAGCGPSWAPCSTPWASMSSPTPRRRAPSTWRTRPGA